MYSESSEIVKRELSNAIASMSMCMPLLEEMNGNIPTQILDLLDSINKLSVMY